MAGELIEAYGDDIENITLVRGSKGRFDVSIDGKLLFSKHMTKRHAEPGEIVSALRHKRAA